MEPADSTANLRPQQLIEFLKTFPVGALPHVAAPYVLSDVRTAKRKLSFVCGNTCNSCGSRRSVNHFRSRQRTRFDKREEAFAGSTTRRSLVLPNGLSSDRFLRARPVRPGPDGTLLFAATSLT